MILEPRPPLLRGLRRILISHRVHAQLPYTGDTDQSTHSDQSVFITHIHSAFPADREFVSNHAESDCSRWFARSFVRSTIPTSVNPHEITSRGSRFIRS